MHLDGADGVRVGTSANVPIGRLAYGQTKKYDTVAEAKPRAIELLTEAIQSQGGVFEIRDGRWRGFLDPNPRPDIASALTVDDITFTTYRHGDEVSLQASYTWEEER